MLFVRGGSFLVWRCHKYAHAQTLANTLTHPWVVGYVDTYPRCLFVCTFFVHTKRRACHVVVVSTLFVCRRLAYRAFACCCYCGWGLRVCELNEPTQSLLLRVYGGTSIDTYSHVRSYASRDMNHIQRTVRSVSVIWLCCQSAAISYHCAAPLFLTVTS